MPSDFLETPNILIFLVDMAQLGRAIGKKGINVERLKNYFKKKVVIIGDSTDVEIFVRNFFNNIEINYFEIMDIMGERNIILTVEEADRGIAIGREGERIKAAKEFLKRKFKATIMLKTKRSVATGAHSRGVEYVPEKALEEDAVIEKKEEKVEGKKEEGKVEKKEKKKDDQEDVKIEEKIEEKEVKLIAEAKKEEVKLIVEEKKEKKDLKKEEKSFLDTLIDEKKKEE
jgi:N utilization substance protein A